MPVAFTHIINNVHGQYGLNESMLTDITILDAWKIIESGYNNILRMQLHRCGSIFADIVVTTNGD